MRLLPGFTAEKRALTIQLVQVLFPGAALLVMSAWCLGILNSHRKFFLSYSAPVIWNVVIITALLWKGGHVTQSRLAMVFCIASVIGSGLQFAVQLPAVMGFLRPLRWKLALRTEQVQTVTRNFFPVFVSRGRGADQRLRGFAAGQLFAFGCGVGAGLRADFEFPAGEFVWHGDFCG